MKWLSIVLAQTLVGMALAAPQAASQAPQAHTTKISDLRCGGEQIHQGVTMEPVPYLSETRVISFSKVPDMMIEPSKYTYQAVLETSKGDIVIDLLADKTPKTVNSFVFLALNHYYEGIYFHRVIPGFMAQTGDPTGTGMSGPGYQFGMEVDSSLRYNKPGVVGMARTQDPNSNGSQFFITYDDSSDFLSGQYTIWGQVSGGMDVVNAIAKTEGVASPARGEGRDQIKSVKIYRTAK